MHFELLKVGHCYYPLRMTLTACTVWRDPARAGHQEASDEYDPT
jgi:hypothetical protein